MEEEYVETSDPEELELDYTLKRHYDSGDSGDMSNASKRVKLLHERAASETLNTLVDLASTISCSPVAEPRTSSPEHAPSSQSNDGPYYDWPEFSNMELALAKYDYDVDDVDRLATQFDSNQSLTGDFAGTAADDSIIPISPVPSRFTPLADSYGSRSSSPDPLALLNRNPPNLTTADEVPETHSRTTNTSNIREYSSGTSKIGSQSSLLLPPTPSSPPHRPQVNITADLWPCSPSVRPSSFDDTQTGLEAKLSKVTDHMMDNEPQINRSASPTPSLPMLSSILSSSRLSSPLPHLEHNRSTSLPDDPVADDPTPLPEPHSGPDELENYELNSGRYSLRTRQAKQLRPYAYDKISYKQQMHGNPDAIVKVVSPSHRRRHRSRSHSRGVGGSGEESQEDEWQPELREARRERRLLDALSRSPKSPRYSEILEDLPEDDEESRALAKEAKRVIRERKARERREKAEAEKEHRDSNQGRSTRRFPIARSVLDDDADDSLPSKSRQLFHHRSASPHSSAGADEGRRPLLHQFPWDNSSPLRDHEGLSLSPIRDGDFSSELIDDHGPEQPSIDTVEGILRNSHSEPIVVDDDESQDTESSNTKASPKPKGRYIELSHAQKRDLGKMWPKVMLKKLELVDETPVSKPRRRSEPRDEVEDGPLKPGQTRRRIAEKPRDIRDIKGDTESSDETELSCHESETSLSEAEGYNALPSAPHHDAYSHTEPICISSEDSDGIDDDDIRSCLNEHPHRSSSIGANRRNENLIDWMLNKSRTVGRTNKSKRKKRHKLDITTNGARRHGPLRQSTLFESVSSVDRHGSSGFKPSPMPQSRERRLKSTENGPASSSTRLHRIQAEGSTARTLKRAKKRKAERRRQGQTYLFEADGTRIMSGRLNSNIITMDIEDEDFHRTLTPRWEAPRKLQHQPSYERIGDKSTGQGVQHPSSMDGASEDRNQAHNSNGPSAHIKTPRHRHVKSDFVFQALPSGRAFHPNSYIGKGWLYELVNLMANGADPPVPPTYSAYGFEFGVDTSTDRFAEDLAALCDRLFDAATGIPEDDDIEGYNKWIGVMRAACQTTSWYRAHRSHSGPSLSDVVENCISQLITRIKAASLSRKSMDVMTFAVLWFSLELLARSGASPASVPSSSDTFWAAVSLLLRHLLAYGLKRSMKPVMALEHELGDTQNLRHYTAELWVCLIHLVEVSYANETSRPAHERSLWRSVIEAIPEMTTEMSNDVEVSEAIWHVIFSLCVLSQFSVHGMATSTSQLPPCWELVSKALKQIKLVADPVVNQALRSSILRKHDKYIGAVICRCHTLVQCWNWSLEGASSVLTQIAEIFRSRKYANLVQERSDFPAFMVDGKWTLLNDDQHSDTAFVRFLKLLVRVNKPERVEDCSRKLTPAVKKLVSLAVPVGTLPSDRDRTPTDAEQAMVYNRYSAAAVALYLEPANMRSRISQARSYVNIATADDTTRVICIRAAMYYAELLITLHLPLNDLWTWMDDILVCLLTEYDLLNSMKPDQRTVVHDWSPRDRKRDRAVFSIQVFIESIRKIIDFYRTSVGEYPDPSILARIIPVTRGSLLTEFEQTAARIRSLMQSFLEARNKVLPPPRRPIHTVAESQQESQEEYGMFDLDLEDPELLAALGEGENAGVLQEYHTKDKIASEAIHAHITPVIYRYMCKVFSKCDGSALTDYRYLDLSLWIDCWIGCANIIVQSRKAEARSISWNSYLDRREDSWGRIKSLPLRRWVDMRVMLALLQTDPMEYPVNQGRFINTLFECFAAAKIREEADYVSLLFSIDGLHHDLLHGMPCWNKTESDHISLSTEQFVDSRVHMFNSILANLNQNLTRENAGEGLLAADNQKYIGSLISMYQVMEAELEVLGVEERREYVAWCHQVHDTVQQYPEVCSQSRLLYWVNWGRNLKS